MAGKLLFVTFQFFVVILKITLITVQLPEDKFPCNISYKENAVAVTGTTTTIVKLGKQQQQYQQEQHQYQQQLQQ
jgi:hypothetical protein